MPNLKKLIVYTMHGEDIEFLQNQKRLNGLNDLEIIFSGFRGVKILPTIFQNTIMLDDIDEIDNAFNNYSKLVENCNWRVSIDYSLLINKFKGNLRSNFFVKFYNVSLEVKKVDDYAKLFEFLKFCPFLES